MWHTKEIVFVMTISLPLLPLSQLQRLVKHPKKMTECSYRNCVIFFAAMFLLAFMAVIFAAVYIGQFFSGANLYNTTNGTAGNWYDDNIRYDNRVLPKLNYWTRSKNGLHGICIDLLVTCTPLTNHQQVKTGWFHGVVLSITCLLAGGLVYKAFWRRAIKCHVTVEIV